MGQEDSTNVNYEDIRCLTGATLLSSGVQDVEKRENSDMVVRLHNLSARAPVLSDISEVAKLLHLCDLSEGTDPERAIVEVRKRWQTTRFQLMHDAWVIMSHHGTIAGYAEVRRNDAGRTQAQFEFTSLVCVHPDFRERGIDTLLIWLVEERARQLAQEEPLLYQRVTLSTVINSQDAQTRALFQHEGYSRVRSFWRVSISMEKLPTTLHEENLLHIDLMLDVDDLPGTGTTMPDSGLYSARQYEVYEKTLCSALAQEIDKIPEMSCAGA